MIQYSGMARWLDYERKTIKPQGEKIDLSWLNGLLTFFLIFGGALIPPSFDRNSELYGSLILFFGFIISLILLRFGIHRTWSLILCGFYGLPLVWVQIMKALDYLGLR